MGASASHPLTKLFGKLSPNLHSDQNLTKIRRRPFVLFWSSSSIRSKTNQISGKDLFWFLPNFRRNTIVIISLRTRGGVEDIRLEAKTKDTKKSEAKDSLSEDRPSRGQGQECSRPRTKDTGASVLQKKGI